MKELSELYPKSLWKHFENICKIPHPSKHEQKMAQFVAEFGEKQGLKTIIDEVGNVIIKKPATKGMENKKTVVLQGHLDMVPQKNNDTKHDFEKDPILPYIDGECVKAKGTTLGADNGIGVAAAMAVLESKDLQHGPVEVLVTSDEETGMTGANGLESTLLNGDIMINMDSEEEGELCIGCAGGIDTTAVFRYKKVNVPADAVAYKISVTGLKGGHSGVDIHLGRGNANKIMNRCLWIASKKYGLRLSEIDGGSLRNAIPREAFVTVTVPKSKESDFVKFVGEYSKTVKNELSVVDPDLKIEVVTTNIPSSLIDETIQSSMINAIYGCPNGVIRMCDDMPEVVETSTNLAIVKSKEDTIEIATLQRSSVESAKEDLTNMIRSVFELAGAEVEHTGGYPGWKPNVKSPILNTMKEVYNKKYGKVPVISVIHAGLECGIIGKAYPKMDMVSCGPTIKYPHSPDEQVNIESVGKFWDFLVETLKNIPQK